MKLNAAIFTIITFLTSTILFANTLSLENNDDGTWNVNYSSDGPIGGFQFNVDGATLTDASGGSAGSAGFLISTSATTALGFSLTGATIPEGEGTLIIISVDGSPTGLSGIVVSDPVGQDMGFSYDDGGDDDGGDGGDDGWDGDACTMPDHSIHITPAGSVLYNSSTSIAGFQFIVDGGSVLSASGGDAGDLGFMISTGGSTVLGFSLSGQSFSGCGTLVEVSMDGDATGLSSIIISDPAGSAIAMEYFDGSDGSDVDGCMDMSACNYNPDATMDDGSCEYAQENYNCDGECIADIDCEGVCGGLAVEDECGECGGDGANEMCWDGSYVCNASDCPDQPGGSVSIMYSSETPIAGFQFDVNGASITSAFGGAAESAGFMVSSSATTVLGFSLTGGTIPAGEGILIELEVDGNADEVCLSNVLLSDASGEAITQMVEDCVNIVAGSDDPMLASVQIIHNSPSPVVDIYVDGALAIENFEFRTATPVLELPISFTVGIAPADGDVIAEFPFELMEGGEYVVVATGILGNTDTPFDLAAAGTTFGSGNGNVGLDIYHGSTDAPAVDIYADGGLLLGDLSYGEFSGYIQVPAADYVVGIAPADGDIIAEFDAPLSGLSGGSAIGFASGFLSGDEPAFGLFAALVDGTVLELPVHDGGDDGGDTGGDDWDGDACTMPDHSIHVTSDGSVLYNSSSSIAGFQFNVDGASVLSAAGGDAEAQGFMISSSATTVLGFSLTGATFSGCGTMIELELDGMATGLSGIIISDPDGMALPIEYFDGSGGGDTGGDDGGDDGGDICDSEVCLSFSNFNEAAGSVDIWIENTVDVAGYQIELDGINITGAAGGLSEESDFLISNSGSMVLGFSVSGDVIPPSSGNLVTLTFSDYTGFICFVDGQTTFSDSDAQSLGISLGDCQGAGPVEGCTDETACNYNSDANIDDGSCDYGTTCWDGSVECDENDCPELPMVDIMYNTDTPIAGFQFTVSGATVVSASGGAAEEAGYSVSAGGSNNAVVGFSLEGVTIDGSGVLTTLDVAGDPSDVCIDNVVISDSAGEPLDWTVVDCQTISIGGGVGPECGDGVCDEGEDADNCPEDCGGVDDCVEGWDGDACTMDANSVHVTSDGMVLYNTDTPIAGFQFDLDGASIVSAAGGNSEAAGFMIQANASTVLGFSLSGATIDGCGTMIELELDGDAAGLSGIIVSDASGTAIPFSYFEGGGGNDGPCCGDGECNGNETSDNCPEDCGDDVPGCTDMEACNYNAEATVDDGSCEYVVDCLGECGGSAVEDECGECNGSGADVMCPDGTYVCDESECSEPGDDPFTFNQSTQFAYYFVFSAYDCEGVYLEAGEDWIGVFNGDVCVGANIWPGGPVEIPAYGDDGESYSAGYLNSGDMPTYKIYDASEGIYYEASPNVNYAYEHLGFNNIQRMDAGISQDLVLEEGANLVSFYILPDDNSVENIMAPIVDNTYAILSGGSAAQYLDGWGWVGSLLHLEYEEGYWLIMSDADELHLEGCHGPSQSLVYDLEPGANLISYPDPGSTDLSSAIPDDVENLFAAVLSDGQAAMNIGSGWVGSLTTLSGGSGYWVIVDEALSFSYNIEGLGRLNVDYYEETRPSDYKVYQSSEQSFYFIENVTLLNGEIENGDWLLSYNGGVLTGIRQWQDMTIDVPAMGYSEYDDINTSGYFVQGQTPTFKLLKNTGSDMYKAGQLIELGGAVEEWSNNSFSIITELVEIKSIPQDFGIMDAYPNPFNPVTTVSYKLPVDSQVSLQVYNLQGRLIETLVDDKVSAGYHSVTWNADRHSSGMYFVKMVSGSQLSTKKLLLVK